MLYVTTRNHQDTFTTHQVLTQDRGSDGGLYLPLHFPKLTDQEIRRLSAMSFGQCVAEMLNLFFCTRLTGWDIDFCVGRYPVRIQPLAHRIMMTETWHNPEWKYQRLEKSLKELVSAETGLPGSWVSVAIRMAVLAGVLGSRELSGAGEVDVAAVSGDFTVPVSAWYLRNMGFPIGNIICCCNENNQFWELLCNGQMRTDGVTIPTGVPEADNSLPVNLERLICDCGGSTEAKRFADCCHSGEIFAVSEGVLRRLHSGMYASVISSSRVETTIPNVYKTHSYVLSPASALAYSGLLDYRTKTAVTRPAVVLCDQSPVWHADAVAKAMDIPVEELRKRI